MEGVGEVAPEWYESHVLAPASAVSEHQFCDLDAEVPLRQELENQLAELLARHGMDHLDIAQVRSRDRVVTQTVSRKLFERDYAGIRFGSNLDDQPCFALFEGHAELVARGDPVDLTPDLESLKQVCAEFGLTIALRPSNN